MNQRPQARPHAVTCTCNQAISSPVEARKLAEELMDVMSALLGIIERETELVRAGKVREAIRLEDAERRAVPPLHGRGREPQEQRRNICSRFRRNY